MFRHSKKRYILHTTTTKIGSCKKRKERYRKPMNTFVPKQIDGWEKSPHSKMWLLFQIWQAWNSVVVIIIIPFHLLFTKAWNWVFWPITECTSKVISLQGGQASFRVSLKIPRFLTTVHPKNFFFVGYGPQKSAKVDYSHGQFFNSGELLAKNYKYFTLSFRFCS